MTQSELDAFGIRADRELEIVEWIFARLGCVLGRSGRGGSGVYVELPTGDTALLTARHVVLPAILSGEVTVSLPSARTTSFLPRAVRIHPRQDAALLYIPADVAVPHRIPWAEWNPATPPTVRKGQAAISSGAPGLWKSQPDVASRRINLTTYLNFWTAVVDPRTDARLIALDVDPSCGVPDSFKGMSGGPVTDLDNRLLGINIHEHRDGADDRVKELHVLPVGELSDLVVPYTPPLNMPEDLTCETAVYSFVAVDKSQSPHEQLRFNVIAEYWRSPSRPDDANGRQARVIAFQLRGGAQDSLDYIVNVESLFFADDDADEARLTALKEEVFYLFADTPYDVTEATRLQ